MRYGHLDQIKAKLVTLSPVFIGSGESLTKKEYIFDKDACRVYIPDLGKLTGFLSKCSLIKQFERYLLQTSNNDLYAFLEENKVSRNDYKEFIIYELDAGEVTWQDKFRGIMTFLKGPDGYPYIPGSSLKGAIRTAIAVKLLEKGDLEQFLSSVEREAEDFRNPYYYIRNTAEQIESALFRRLNISDPRNPNRVKPNNILNDIMRGLQISDSMPISHNHMTLCGKYDRKPDGYTSLLPIYRECLTPGTVTEFSITIDRTVLSGFGIDASYINDALTDYANKQEELFCDKFIRLIDDAEQPMQKGAVIFLGGGAGYQSKTITYPLFRNQQRAVKVVGRMMTKQFRNHKHESDSEKYKVSPHTLKMTMYKGKYYQVGKCSIEFIS